ncbi:hypothetical protein PGT21_028287 [Puccinia graminis f. sp. tritici]|uniref:Uncharacterized protein n=2 Tax=Puccinia graminis f. sp. tritici TaxID=56615 RepID=A0A5B0P945_PUCGR|nr:hypothetical protein PGT21_028287 [Puccinia graminis f. sp. tritici]
MLKSALCQVIATSESGYNNPNRASKPSIEGSPLKSAGPLIDCRSRATYRHIPIYKVLGLTYSTAICRPFEMIPRLSPTLERWPILPDELESYSVENFLGLSYIVAPSLSPAELEQEWELSQSTRQEFSLQTVAATPLQLHSENPHTAAKKLKYNDELQLSGSRSIPSSQLFQFNAPRHLNSVCCEYVQGYRRGDSGGVYQSMGPPNWDNFATHSRSTIVGSNSKTIPKTKRPYIRNWVIEEPLLHQFFLDHKNEVVMSPRSLIHLCCHSKPDKQRQCHLKTLYKCLLQCTYENHENLLDHFNLPIYTYKDHQTKLLEWLHTYLILSTSGDTHRDENFDESVRSTHPVGQDYLCNGSLDATQVILVKYFSQPDYADQMVQFTASHLVEQYQTQNKINYSLLSQPSWSIQEKSMQLEKDPILQQEILFLKCLAINLENSKAKLNWEAILQRPRYETLVPCWSDFKKEYRKVTRVFADRSPRCTLKTYHPLLPILLIFNMKSPTHGNLRILKAENRSLIEEIVVIRKIQVLIRTLDEMYEKFLKTFIKNDHQEEGDEGKEERKNLLRWLIKILFRPEDSIPIIGVIQIDHQSQLAPWDKKKSINSFGKVQIKLIEFLSHFQTQESLNNTAAFVLYTWLHNHQSNKSSIM